MAQQLIVEGKDAIALANLAKKRGLPPPLGYESDTKFKTEFVTVGGSDAGALKAFEQVIEKPNPDLTNIGLVLDADAKGFEARWSEIRSLLEPHFHFNTLAKADGQKGPKVVIEDGMPTVGIWIMPDNASPGYLEHFLAGLVPEGNDVWQYAKDTVAAMPGKPFRPSQEPKALLHTWLAWQKEPGMPFGLAIQTGYFDHKAATVQPFLDWFSHTFQLSSPAPKH